MTRSCCTTPHMTLLWQRKRRVADENSENKEVWRAIKGVHDLSASSFLLFIENLLFVAET